MHLDRNKIKLDKVLKIRPSHKKNKLTQDKTYKKPIIRQKKDNNYLKSKSKISIPSSKAATVRIRTRINDVELYKKLKKCKDILKGHPAFLLGNSPSMTNHNLSLLDDYFTIGVNRIFFIYTPTILFWQDLEMWTKHKKDLLKCNSMRVCRNISDPQNIFVNFLLGQNPPRFPETPQVLYGRGNSGILVAQLAYALGCSSVILLGMDCKYEKDKTNFYGKNKDHKTYTMKMCRNSMKWLKNNCPIPIYNCSNIDLWPFMTLEDAIRKSNPIPKGKKYFTNLFLTGKHKNESD